MKKRALSLLLTLTMLLSLVPAFGTVASAEPANNYIDENGAGYYHAATEVSNSDFTWGDDGNDGWYIVNNTITVTGTYTVSGNVKLILADGCKLTVTAADASSKAGINVTGSNSLTIYGQEKGTGALTAKGASYGAGIGGNKNCAGSGITINGGTVTATGGSHGAGIGGGGATGSTKDGGDGSNITINGGIVTAKGGSNGAGIGGGGNSATSGSPIGGVGSNITINGGTVTATGGSSTTDGIGCGASKRMGKNTASATDITVNESLYIKSGASSASSETFHFSSADDANFKLRYLKISPELCEIDNTKYGFLEDAIAQGSGKTITLLRDFTATANYQLASNTTIALKGKVLSVSSGKRITSADDSIAFDIASGTDMETVNALNKNTSKFDSVNRIRVPEKQVWNIKNDIQTKSKISVSKLTELTINGNNNTISGISGGEGGNYLMSFVNSLGEEKEFYAAVTNLKVVTNNNFEGCVYVASNTGNPDKRANVTFDNVTFDNTSCAENYAGACIINNWGSVTLKGVCTLKTGVNSYSAIDLTNKSGNAELTIDSLANVTFTDGRVEAKKATEPLIGQDGTSVDYTYAVTGAAAAGLRDSLRYGVYHNVPGTKGGFDFPVCKMNNVEYGSISKAVDVAGNTSATIQLIANDVENITIASGKNITLDLNGKVLSGSGTSSVITNEGTLTIKDSNPAAVHKFSTATDVWALDETNGTATVTGGVITGGLDIWGGGVNNKGTFTFASGNIVGCKAAAIGGGSGGQQGGEQQQATNESTFRGGAVYNSGIFNVTGGQISGCASVEEGGAIFNEGTATLTTGLISFCSAQNGGAIYNSTQTDLAVRLNISNCTANGTEDGTGYGGAIYNAKDAVLTLTGSIEKCRTEKFGGGVFNKGIFTMNTGAVIKECSAEKGAGVHNDGNTWVTFTMNGGTIKDNSAAKNGGGVQNSENAIFNFYGGSITGNNAVESYGGGVFTKGTMTVKNTAAISSNTTGSATKIASNLAVVKGHPLTQNNFSGSIGVQVIDKVSGTYKLAEGAFTTNGTENDVRYFNVDDDSFAVKINNNNTTENATDDYLELVQSTFYVSSSGNNSTGNGTSANPYETIQKAAQMAYGKGKVKLLSNIDIYGWNTLPDNTTVILNNFGITQSAPANRFNVGANFVFEIGSQNDLKTAASISQKNAYDKEYTWKLTKNINLSERIGINSETGNYGKITIDGQGYTITASNNNTNTASQQHVFYFRNYTAKEKTVEIKNLTIALGNGFRNGICFDKDGNASHPAIKATLTDLTVKANRTIAPLKGSSSPYTPCDGTLIQNNSCSVTVKGKFKLTTDESCWAAIDVDSERSNAAVNFDDAAVVSVKDNRTAAKKRTEPLIKLNNYYTVDESDKASYPEANTTTVTGACLTNKFVEVKSGNVLLGYNLKPVSSGGDDPTYAVTTADAAHGSVSVDKKNASVGATVTLTVKPDKGWTLETLTVKDAKGNEVALTAVKVGETYTFKMPEGAVTVTATFMEDNTMLNFFVDVKADDYFYDAVLWAAENGITSGVDATHFAPNNITTRGQMVTFLWRAAGCPEPTTTTCTFTDLKVDEFYYKAVLWAVEKGLTKGVSATEFAPDVTVDRAQSVTFLARYEGVKDDATGYSHGFADVAAADYYNNAVAWAAANKVTEGTSATTFAPNDSCLRAQIVTFIYRNFAK